MAIYAELKVQTEFPDDLPCRTCSELDPVVYVKELRSWDTLLSRTIICKCCQRIWLCTIFIIVSSNKGLYYIRGIIR